MQNIKKFLVLTFALILILSASACHTKIPDKENTQTDVKTECIHNYEESITSPAMPLRDGEAVYTCQKCSDTYTEVLPMTKTLKILAIGNSFSVDAMEYLWDICRDGGVETIILGNLYIGGCTLDKHKNNLEKNASSYTYYKNTDGEWSETSKTSIQTAFADENWDIITLQQASGSSGIHGTYSSLNYIVNEVARRNHNADIYWHMTWAYQQDSTHSEFPNYLNNQTSMYKAIINTLKQRVLPNESIKGVIPSGTAIQNLRSSYVGDTVTRDGYHMSYDYGRYTTALTWFAYLTGGNIDAITWVPKTYENILSENLAVIKESVKNALAEPYKVTESKIEN